MLNVFFFLHTLLIIHYYSLNVSVVLQLIIGTVSQVPLLMYCHNGVRQNPQNPAAWTDLGLLVITWIDWIVCSSVLNISALCWLSGDLFHHQCDVTDYIYKSITWLRVGTEDRLGQPNDPSLSERWTAIQFYMASFFFLHTAQGRSRK